MNKEQFQALSIENQVLYINMRMKEGETLTNACKSIGMTKELSRKFQRSQYKLVGGQFIPTNKPTETSEVATDIISTPKVKEVKKPTGRPKRIQKVKKITNEIDFKVYKKLKHYCIDEDVDMREVIEKLLIEFLK